MSENDDKIISTKLNVKESYTSNINSIMSRSRAELIVNIQTGQRVINYSLIFIVIISIISSLMIMRKKVKE